MRYAIKQLAQLLFHIILYTFQQYLICWTQKNEVLQYMYGAYLCHVN